MSINVSSVLSSVPLIDGGVNASDRTAVPNTGLQVKAAEFVVKLGIRNGKRIKTRLVEYSAYAYGSTTSVNVTMEDLIRGAGIIASNIAALSKGVLLGFYMKCGKYRNDEEMPLISEGSLNTAVLTFDNNNVTVNDCGVPSSGTIPQRVVSQTICIPYVGDDVSLQTITDTLKQELDLGDSKFVTLGVSRFDKTQNKVLIQAFDTTHKVYGKVTERDKIALIEFINNDEVLGTSDNILSEKYNDVIENTSALPTPPEHAAISNDNNQGGNNG